MDKETIYFIYNAKKGFLNKLLDAGHKLVSPTTYQCDLCALTHSHFGPNKNWSKFLNELEFPVVFLYKDEIPEGWKIDAPAVVKMRVNREVEIMVDKVELAKQRDAEALIDLLKLKFGIK